MDIDNGVKIARKVDNLRETLSVLETKHALFNEATTKEAALSEAGACDASIARNGIFAVVPETDT